MVSERVLRWNISIKNGFELGTTRWKSWKLKRARRFKSDKENALAVLRYNALGINDFNADVVAESFFQSAINCVKRSALVVIFEVFDIFQNEGGRLVVLQNVGNLEEEVALHLVIKTVLATQAQLFRDAGN